MRKLGLIAIMAVVVLASCKTDYEKMEDRELASGVRIDTAFLGLHFGMTRDSFYTYCRRMNQQGQFIEGHTGNEVLYKVDTTWTKEPVYMEFYPVFDDKSKIIELPIKFHYKRWTYFNDRYVSDSLYPEVLSIVERWYGTGFLKIEQPEKGTIYAKVQGNRRILVGKHDEKHIMVRITDLTAKQ